MASSPFFHYHPRAQESAAIAAAPAAAGSGCDAKVVAAAAAAAPPCRSVGAVGRAMTRIAANVMHDAKTATTASAPVEYAATASEDAFVDLKGESFSFDEPVLMDADEVAQEIEDLRAEAMRDVLYHQCWSSLNAIRKHTIHNRRIMTDQDLHTLFLEAWHEQSMIDLVETLVESMLEPDAKAEPFVAAARTKITQLVCDALLKRHVLHVAKFLPDA